MLLQEQPGNTFRPVGCCSPSLTKPQKACDTIQPEFLAIVLSVLIIRPYLKRNPFTIRTDHDYLKLICNLADKTGRLARWGLRLSQFEFDDGRLAGTEQKAADTLSRMPADSANTTPIEDEILIAVIDMTSYRFIPKSIYHSSLYAVRLLPMWLRTTESAPDAPTLEPFIEKHALEPSCQQNIAQAGSAKADFTVDENGLVARKATIDGAIQILAPRALRKQLLYHSHHSVTVVHPVKDECMIKFAESSTSRTWRMMYTIPSATASHVLATEAGKG